jgi:hypothetical protein
MNPLRPKQIYIEIQPDPKKPIETIIINVNDICNIKFIVNWETILLPFNGKPQYKLEFYLTFHEKWRKLSLSYDHEQPFLSFYQRNHNFHGVWLTKETYNAMIALAEDIMERPIDELSMGKFFYI